MSNSSQEYPPGVDTASEMCYTVDDKVGVVVGRPCCLAPAWLAWLDASPCEGGVEYDERQCESRG